MKCARGSPQLRGSGESFNGTGDNGEKFLSLHNKRLRTQKNMAEFRRVVEQTAHDDLSYI